MNINKSKQKNPVYHHTTQWPVINSKEMRFYSQNDVNYDILLLINVQENSEEIDVCVK